MNGLYNPNEPKKQMSRKEAEEAFDALGTVLFWFVGAGIGAYACWKHDLYAFALGVIIMRLA